MCGRYGLFAELDNLAEELDFPPHPAQSGYRHSWNIAPSASILVLAAPRGERKVGMMRWGMSPAGRGAPAARLLFNARSETLNERPTFESRRRLVPANGFYEWQAAPGQDSSVDTQGGRTATRVSRTVRTRLGDHPHRRRQLPDASNTPSDARHPLARRVSGMVRPPSARRRSPRPTSPARVDGNGNQARLPRSQPRGYGWVGAGGVGRGDEMHKL